MAARRQWFSCFDNSKAPATCDDKLLMLPHTHTHTQRLPREFLEVWWFCFFFFFGKWRRGVYEEMEAMSLRLTDDSESSFSSYMRSVHIHTPLYRHTPPIDSILSLTSVSLSSWNSETWFSRLPSFPASSLASGMTPTPSVVERQAARASRRGGLSGATRVWMVQLCSVTAQFCSLLSGRVFWLLSAQPPTF